MTYHMQEQSQEIKETYFFLFELINYYIFYFYNKENKLLLTKIK